MLDRGSGFSEPSKIGAEQSKADFRGRISLDHLFADDDRLLHINRGHIDLRFPRHVSSSVE
jgi:hypothetical protein